MSSWLEEYVRISHVSFLISYIALLPQCCVQPTQLLRMAFSLPGRALHGDGTHQDSVAAKTLGDGTMSQSAVITKKRYLF